MKCKINSSDTKNIDKDSYVYIAHYAEAHLQILQQK